MLIVPTQWDVPLAYPGTMLNYLVFVGAELLVGLCLGLGITILFSGIQLAGTVIGQVGGLMVADVLDPSAGEQVSLFSRLLYLVTLVVFVSIGGHRMVMAGLLDTFQSIPPGSAAMPVSMADTLVDAAHPELRPGRPRGGAGGDGDSAVHAGDGPDRPDAAAVEHPGGRLRLNSMLTFGVLAIALGAAVMVFQDQVEPTITMLLDALHPTPS